MKKLFLSALLMVALATSSFADVNKINGRILNNFNSAFSEASNVQWTLKETFAKATFISDNEKMEAFYDLNGEMIGTSRAVTIEHMPTNVKREFAKKYADYVIKEMIRFDGMDETAFYISAENEKKSIIFKVSDAGTVSIFKTGKVK